MDLFEEKQTSNSFSSSKGDLQQRSKLFLFAILLFLAGCGTDAVEEISISGEWSLIGFEGESIQFVRSTSSGKIYLSTETELYRSHVGDLSNWIPKNMNQVLKEGERIRDFLVFSETEILGVVLWKYEVSPEEHEQYWDNFVSLFRTTGGGENWEPLYNEFTENGPMLAIFQQIRECRHFMRFMAGT